MLLKTPPVQKAPASGRREMPRLEVVDYVQGRVEPGNLSVKVLDIGVSGFGIESSTKFTPGTTHNFRMTLTDGSSTVIAGTVVHCEKRLTKDGSDLYLTGLRFPERADGSPDVPGELIDKVLSVISFDIQ